jgi:uncharacterized membrane protein
MKPGAALIILAAFALSLAIYPLLPARIPIHWNLAGNVDGFAPKLWGAFLMPLTILGIALILIVVPRISPAGFEVDKGSRGYVAISLSVLVFMLAVHIFTLATALNPHIAFPRFVPVFLGALFAVLGNYLGKVRRNFFVGIRTPWTLADDDVWFRTHRLGGKLFVAGGILTMLGALLPTERGVTFAVVIAVGVSLISIVYSYVIYRQLHGAHS